MGGSAMMCSLSALDQNKINAIKEMEQKIGKTVLAFSCREIEPAELTREELALIADTEKQLGLLLIAVKSS
jgi:hypothetical protein